MKAPNENNRQKPSREENLKREERIDYELDQTFPASDPPSYSKPGNDYRRKRKN